MKAGARKFLIGATVLAVTGSAVGAGCPAVVDSIWEAAMGKAAGAISLAIGSLVEAVSVERTANLMRLQSTIRVLAKQVEISGEKQSSTEVASKQAGANYMVELSNRKAVFETTMQYNATTGQGFDPCGETRRAQNVHAVAGEANAGISERVMAELDTAPGNLVGNQADVVARRLSNAQTLYGPNGQLAGKDVDAGHFFTSAQVGSPEAQAKSALLNNMYGIPYQAPDKSAANSPAGKAFFEAKRTEDVYRSVGQASMKTVQSWTDSRAGSSSAIDAISSKVGTYAGGNNYPQWEQAQTTQSERGLMIELARMRAFDLYLRNQESEQMARQEATLAALVAIRARSGDRNLDAQRAAQHAKTQ